MNARSEIGRRARRRSLALAGVAVLLCGLVAGASSVATAAVVRSDIVTGTDAGVGGGHVKTFSGADGSLLSSFFAYATQFTGGVRVAAGDINGDGRSDIITGSGPGATHVEVFSGQDGSLLRSFLAYGSFTGGVFVAAGDVNGDGRDDVITGADAGAPAHVKVFSGLDGSEVRSFFAYATQFTGGVRVAAGDVNGDGRLDIVTGTGAGADHVKVFDGVGGSELRSFLAYGGFTGGVFVAAGDVNRDGRDDVITGTDAGTPGGHVKVFDGQTGALLSSFLAYDTAFTGGVRVAVGDVNGDGRADIIAGTGHGGGHVKVFSVQDGSLLRSFLPYGAYTGGIFVAGRAAGAHEPRAEIAELIETVESYDLSPRGHERSLVAKLEAARARLAAGDADAACGVLRAFLNHVRARTGKALTDTQAAELTASAKAIRAALGCR